MAMSPQYYRGQKSTKPKSMVGTFEAVSGDFVSINNIWYNASNVRQFIPPTVGIQVEYNSDEEYNLLFIRALSAPQTQRRTPYAPRAQSHTRPPVQTGAMYNSPSPSSTQPESGDIPLDSNTSIVRQVVYKVAAWLLQNEATMNIEDKIREFKRIRRELEKDFYEGE